MAQSIKSFATDFETFVAQNRAKFNELGMDITDFLAAHTNPKTLESDDAAETISDFFDEQLDSLTGVLAAKAANEAGDDEQAQEDAIEAVEAWVGNHICNGSRTHQVAAVLWLNGLKKGEELIRQQLQSADTVELELKLNVRYALHGENATEMVARLQRMVETAMGEGLLTGESDAEVVEHALAVRIKPQPIAEEDLTDFFNQRMTDGIWDLQDVTARCARYGLMDPCDFIEEMAERMAL